MTTETTETTPTLADLRTAGRRVGDAKRELAAALAGRDEAIKEVRRRTAHTVAEIAEAAGVEPPTVKAVVRGITRQTA